jgi:DHA1 family bicyclomycin/chloramphenicol resistance-like MFS transporter
LKDFKQAFTHLAFWQVTIVISLLFAGYISFLSGTSVFFVVELGMSKSTFPFIQAAILGAWVAGSLLLNRFIAKWGVVKVKKAGIILCVIGGVGHVVAALIMPKDPYLLTCGMLFYAFGANWIIGLYFPEGMEILPNIKGIAASLLTSARLLIAAMVVGLTSALYNATVYPLAAVILGTIVVILPTLISYEKRKVAISKETA